MYVSGRRDGKSDLIWAAETGDAARVRALLASGADPNEAVASGWTALMVAALGGDPDTVRALLGAGAELGVRDRFGRNALFIAAVKRSHPKRGEAVRVLLEWGADATAQTEDGRTPLIAAAGKGSPRVVKVLVDAGADVDARDRLGWTPLIYAAHECRWDNLSILVLAGADLTPKSHGGRTALMTAACRECYSLSEERITTRQLRLLVAAGADLDEKDEAGRNALLIAAEKGHTTNTRAMLEANATVNIQFESLETTFLRGAAEGCVSSVVDGFWKLRQRRGGYVNAALLMATSEGQVDTVEALLDLGACANHETEKGWTVLMEAVFRNRPGALRALLERGANPDPYKIQNQSVLTFARQQGYREVARLLQDAVSGGESGGRRS